MLPTQTQATSDAAASQASEEAINSGTRNRNPADVSFWALVGEDFATHESRFFAQGFWTLFWHRFGNLRMSIRFRVLRLPLSVLYRVGSKAAQWFCGMDLPYTVVVGRRVKLEHFGGMILIARSIGDDVIIRQNTTFGIAKVDAAHDRPTIGDRVDIGAGAVVLGGITIGEDTQIGANAVVTKSLPASVVAGGVPARVIKSRD